MSSPPTRLWLVTGPPGIGKSTLVSKVVFSVRSSGRGVGGCLTKEVRKGRERKGFRIIDLLSGNEAELATIGGLGPRVGSPQICWAKFEAMAEGARLASKELWGR